MKWVAVTCVVTALLLGSEVLRLQAIAVAASSTKCIAPGVDGEITIVTISVREGLFFVDCQYGAARPQKSKRNKDDQR